MAKFQKEEKMLEFKLRPEILGFDTCHEFADFMQFTADDAIITNRYIYEPFLGHMKLPCRIIFQEDYGTGEPSDSMAQAMINDFHKLKCNRLVAIGGGTVIDLAKIISVSRQGKSVDDMYSDMASLRSCVELDIVPTTCGTGSEATNIAILERKKLGTKMGMVAESMYAKYAILVPEFLESLPWQVFATSSLDALVHAVESLLSPKATPFTLLFSRQAMDIIINSYQIIRKDGRDKRKELYDRLLLASNYAGIAFGIAGCAAVHAVSYPLGGVFHIPHGEANYSIFMEVLNLYGKKVNTPVFREFLLSLANSLFCAPDKALASLSSLLESILPLKPLREYGMTEKEVKAFPALVLKSQQRLLANNPVELDESDILSIYCARW